MVMWMVGDSIPFSCAESARFRWMLNLLKPGIVLPSAVTTKRETMDHYHKEATHVGERLRNAGSKISVTLDCWTSPNVKAFLGITAHYVDDTWTLRSLVLDFVPLAGSHSGEELCEAFVAECDRFGILGKLLGVTTDNAANIHKLLVRLQSVCLQRHITFDAKEQHVRCIAHISNLAVQALLRELRAESVDDDASFDNSATTQAEKLPCVNKLRRLVFKIRGSPQRREELKAQCHACGVAGRELIGDTRTRWDSTHAMIERACELRVPLSKMAEGIHRGLYKLSEDEWKLLEMVSRVLGIFRNASRPLCATNYPTLNKAVTVYNYMLDELEGFLGMRNEEAEWQDKTARMDACGSPNVSVLRDAIQAAYDKIHAYYEDTWARMYAISVILDPTLKMEYYKVNNWGPKLMTHAKDALLQTIDEYATSAPQSHHVDVETYSGPVEERIYGPMKRRCVQKDSEIEGYLSMPVASKDTDILEWWKHHADTYPRLARIARDYLAIPATSVPAERVFSGGADLITDKRGSLNEDTIRACLCLSSWSRCWFSPCP
jgi:hAT family protein